MKIIINGKEYQNIVTELTRGAEIEYSDSTGENLDGSMTLDPLGTRLTYDITFDGSFGSQKQMQEIWEIVTTPHIEGIDVIMPYNDTKIELKVYVDSVSQSYTTTYNNQKIWDKISVSFASVEYFKEAL